MTLFITIEKQSVCFTFRKCIAVVFSPISLSTTKSLMSFHSTCTLATYCQIIIMMMRTLPNKSLNSMLASILSYQSFPFVAFLSKSLCSTRTVLTSTVTLIGVTLTRNQLMISELLTTMASESSSSSLTDVVSRKCLFFTMFVCLFTFVETQRIASDSAFVPPNNSLQSSLPIQSLLITDYSWAFFVVLAFIVCYGFTL